MNDKYIILIVGKSGSGKSTICRQLENEYGLKELKSYTTRKCRGTNDNSHTFITKEEFDKLTDIIAYTEFDGNYYCATKGQIDESDLYIVDVDGVKFFLERYDGKKIPIVIYIETDKATRINRMMERGDDVANAYRRVEHDDTAFNGVEDYAFAIYINNDVNGRGVIEISRDIYETFFEEKEN